MTQAQVQVVAALAVELINAGVAIEGAAAAAIKGIVGMFHKGTPSDADIDAGFAAVLATDQVIAAKASAQSGQ